MSNHYSSWGFTGVRIALFAIIGSALLTFGVTGIRASTLESPANLGIVSVSLPNVVATPGLVTVPITVSNLTGLGVSAYDLQITFDPAVVTPAVPAFDTAGTLSSGMTVTANPSFAGHLIIQAFQGMPLSGFGTLINLKFNLAGPAGQSSTLVFENYVDPVNNFHPGVIFNNGQPAASTTNGSITAPNTGVVSVSLPIVFATPGLVTVPITVGNLTNQGIISYDLQIPFNPAVLTPAVPAFDTAGTLSSGMAVAPNALYTGHLIIKAVQGMPLSGSGTLINLKFNLTGPAGQSIPLVFGDYTDPGNNFHPGFRFNNGQPAASITNGSISAPITFLNTAAVTIPANGVGTPYPSTIGASGFVNVSAPELTGTITKITVDLVGLSHTNPDDLDIMLVSPSGQTAIIMSDVGGGSDILGVNLTLDDDAAASLPDETQIVSGTFKPTNFDLSGDAFPAPAPASSGGSAFSVFNGTDPNGTWSLYVYDDQSGEAGSISGGWALNITTSVGTITGTVIYGNAAAPPKYISNVTVLGTGSPNVFTTTAAPGGTAGQYTLTGFGAGSYTVGVSKTTGQNGVSSADAARIAQHVAGTLFITSDRQKIAADVTNNGAISSTDAAQLARFVTALGPPIGLTNQWRFFVPNPTFPIGASPTTRTYPSITSNITGDDYIGILVGEVTGNWNPTAARMADGRQEAGDLSQEAYGSEKAGIAVGLPEISVKNGQITIPVSVQGIADKGVISYEFDLRYDPSVIQPVGDGVDVSGTVSRGLSVVTNATEPGLLRVVVYGAYPIDGDGVLLNLRFMAVGTAGSVSPISFERIMFNEGEPRVVATDGKVELAGL